MDQLIKMIKHDLFELCESTEENVTTEDSFSRGRCFEARSIRRSISDCVDSTVNRYREFVETN